MEDNLLLILVTTVCVLFLVTFGLILRSLAKFDFSFTEALNGFLQNEKNLTANLGRNISNISLSNKDLRQALTEIAKTKDELQIKIQNLDIFYHVSDTINQRDTLKAQLLEKNDAFNALLVAKDEVKEQLDLVQNEKKNQEVELLEERSKVAKFKDQTAGYEACLPVVGVDPIYREVVVKCGVSEDDQPRLHYTFSRLAVLVALKNLTVNSSDKSVYLRDAFIALDQALYAQFRGNAELLQQLRSCFEDELKPLLDGSLRFSWPKPNDSLNLKEHQQDPENGGGVIKEVRSAILYTGAGELIQLAVVLT